MGALSPTHWLIVVGVLVLLFGAKKLPDMARSVGQSARVLKGELSDLKNENPPAALPEAGTAAAMSLMPGAITPSR